MLAVLIFPLADSAIFTENDADKVDWRRQATMQMK